ncbi:hypothetical protein CCAX7_26170 [Capsulimonas corticalis]|uniref:Uncharacterized protein n=1 Tax=Capsulimonas corticalis TaxID=2219043 RepID=A0A402D792_9BACT|nr:hypothetical protein CCAX7_26170 [Capsulimonas corticalis]
MFDNSCEFLFTLQQNRLRQGALLDQFVLNHDPPLQLDSPCNLSGQHLEDGYLLITQFTRNTINDAQ